MAGKSVQVENREKDIKHLGVKLEDGRELVLGSSDDMGKKDKDGKELLQPVQFVPAGVWEKAMKLKAVQGMVNNKQITYHGA